MRAASFPGTVPRRRVAFARVKIVLRGVEGAVDDFEIGVRVGVERFLFVGVKRDIVRFAETGVSGRATHINIFALADGTHGWRYLLS